LLILALTIRQFYRKVGLPPAPILHQLVAGRQVLVLAVEVVLLRFIHRQIDLDTGLVQLLHH
jgi:hypothetical protein